MAGLAANDPTVTLDGADPGLVAHDQDESTLDAEWSGAAAPAAAVNLVVAATTATTDGIDLAAAWIVNHATRRW
jgi:subtilase family serine protease